MHTQTHINYRIFTVSNTLYILLYNYFSNTTKLSQSEIFSEKLLLYLLLYIWHFNTSTPSQSEIFSQSYLVASSLCSYVCIGLSTPEHPPKVKYSLKSCYCSFFCIFGLSRPKHPPKVKYFFLLL